MHYSRTPFWVFMCTYSNFNMLLTPRFVSPGLIFLPSFGSYHSVLDYTGVQFPPGILKTLMINLNLKLKLGSGFSYRIRQLWVWILILPPTRSLSKLLYFFKLLACLFICKMGVIFTSLGCYASDLHIVTKYWVLSVATPASVIGITTFMPSYWLLKSHSWLFPPFLFFTSN